MTVHCFEGVTGPSGPQGSIGASGFTGATGSSGQIGASGATGIGECIVTPSRDKRETYARKMWRDYRNSEYLNYV